MHRRIRALTCSVAWCAKTSDESTFFKFPTNASRAEQWETTLVYKSNVESTKRVLCQDHFEEKCFVSTLKKNLLSTAVPTIQVKIKKERITNDEASQSQFSVSEVHTNNGTKTASFPGTPGVIREVKGVKNKSVDEINKILDDYLQRRHLVHSKLKKLSSSIAKPSVPKSVHSLTIQTATMTLVKGNVQNAPSNKNFSESNRHKKQKTTHSKEMKECDLNLMSCCLMDSIDKSAGLENYAMDESKFKAFDIQTPNKAENKIRKIECKKFKSSVGRCLSNNSIFIKKDLINTAKTGIFETVKEFDNLPKTLILRNKTDMNTMTKDIKSSSKMPSEGIENSVFKTAKERCKNLSNVLTTELAKDASEFVKNNKSKASKDPCTPQISNDNRCYRFKSCISEVLDQIQSKFEIDSGNEIKEQLSKKCKCFDIKTVENSTKTSFLRAQNGVFMTPKKEENLPETSCLKSQNGLFTTPKQVGNSPKISGLKSQSALFMSPKKVKNSPKIPSLKSPSAMFMSPNKVRNSPKISSLKSQSGLFMTPKEVGNSPTISRLKSPNGSLMSHKKVENSPKKSSIKKHVSNMVIKRIEDNSFTPLRLKTDNSVFPTLKENAENQIISEETDPRESDSKDVCILEISEDYNSFAASIGERLKNIQDPFVRIKALLGIQQVLLEAEYSLTEKT